MMHVIINERLYDEEYVTRHTLGFDALRERVQGYSPEWAAPLTGIPVERIRALAVEYATTRPAAIRINYGMQRHRGGGMAARTITCLPALVGAWRLQGGGIQLSTSGDFPFDRSTLYRPELRARPAREFNMNRLGDMLSKEPDRIARAHHHPRPIDPVPTPEEAGSPIYGMIVYNSNPAAVAPDQSAVIEGLEREDLFTVVLDHFLTDTASYADYVLPATTQLEHWDILKPYGHLYIALNRPAIAPIGEALPNSEARYSAALPPRWATTNPASARVMSRFCESSPRRKNTPTSTASAGSGCWKRGTCGSTCRSLTCPSRRGTSRPGVANASSTASD
jgi:anaerobic selenocysteine-containing dehydrogenase